MLNNIAWQTRLLIFGFGFALGVMLAGPSLDDRGDVAVVLLIFGLGLEVLVLLAWSIALRHAERRFRRLVVAATAEIAAGEVQAVPGIARVVRRRIVKRGGWFLPGAGSGSGPAVLTVLTVLGDGPPRRVAALVPGVMGLAMRKAPAAVLIHPRERDVAVVDDRITREQVAEIGRDPRWDSERLPTDRSVVGGYLALVVSMLVGVAAGVGVGAALVMLAT